MILVLDTNILISALIRDSHTWHLIIYGTGDLCYPESALQEILDHKEEIVEKAGISTEEFNALFAILLRYIQLVPTVDMMPFLSKAEETMQDVDPKDAIFIAAALSRKASIWSNDKHLKEQRLVSVFTTVELSQDPG